GIAEHNIRLFRPSQHRDVGHLDLLPGEIVAPDEEDPAPFAALSANRDAEVRADGAGDLPDEEVDESQEDDLEECEDQVRHPAPPPSGRWRRRPPGATRAPAARGPRPRGSHRASCRW